LPLPART